MPLTESLLQAVGVGLQAAHVRKSSYVVSRHGYHPESHHANTIHSGTYVQQVSLHVFQVPLNHACQDKQQHTLHCF